MTHKRDGITMETVMSASTTCGVAMILEATLGMRRVLNIGRYVVFVETIIVEMTVRSFPICMDSFDSFVQTTPLSDDGVLGGYGHISPVDVSSSKTFLQELPRMQRRRAVGKIIQEGLLSDAYIDMITLNFCALERLWCRYR
jgi:hypothetical protein